MFVPVATGRFFAFLPYLGFTRPPVVAAAPFRSNPLLFWIRGDSIPAPGAGERNKRVRGCKCLRQPGSFNRFATRETNAAPSGIHSRAGGRGIPSKSPACRFTAVQGRRRISSKLQSRTSGLPMASSTSFCAGSKEISR